ncbi:LamG-like jellyroll fold domain-containing protein [Clostridium sp.]|uniref:LamG-like jellyroll fold domain-containing protein n=1 Tax=Clostridium sp. TaxID=1506 RepID=UPI0025C20AC2|nr:LamG-like jellyroll fold domain-containing protein [Clostridium sp.]
MRKKRILNLFLSITLIMTCISSLSVVNAKDIREEVNIEKNLIGYWNFNDGNLTNLANSNKNGELIGSQISIEDSDMGKALLFGNDSDSYMKIPEFINTGSKPYSISMWYKYNEKITSHNNTILAQQDGNGRSLLILTTNDKYRSFVNGVNVDSNSVVDISIWQHVTMTIDPESNKIKYYINGKLDSEKDAGSKPVNELTNLLIGRHKNGGKDPDSMKGEIDELRVYDRIINDSEAKAIYDSVESPNKTMVDGLIGYWNFDNGNIENLVGDKDGQLIGKNVTIGTSSNEEMGKSLIFNKGNDSSLRIDSFLNTGENPYSFSLWYKTGEISKDRHTVLLQQGDAGKSILILRLDNKYDSYVNGKDVLSSDTVTNGNWENVIITINPKSNKIKYYINGEFDGEYDAGDSQVKELTSLIIGNHKAPNSINPQQFIGEMDEIRVYDYVISDNVAKEIYEDKVNKNVKLKLKLNEVERSIDRATFGINHRYAFNGYGSFDSESGKMREDFSVLYKNANFGSLRYPGGTISNLFRWKDSIGDLSNRKNQIHGFYSAAKGIEPNFGLGEVATFADENDSELVYVYGLGRGSAEDAADLIEYLNAEVGTNPNGGIEWAKVRENNGHSEPYNVRYFEIGNEMNQGGGDGSTSQMYWTAYDGNSLEHYINGGAINITKQGVVEPEEWNASTSKSNGKPNQIKYMRYANTIPGRGTVTQEEYGKSEFTAVKEGSVHVYVNDIEWTIVENIKDAGTKNVVEVNYFNGEILFGDGKNGNIPVQGSDIKVSYTVDKDGFVQVSQAMRDTMNQINELSRTNKEINIYSSYETEGFIRSMNEKNYNNLYDGLTIHPYSGTPTGSGEEFYDSAMNLAQKNGIDNVKKYVDMMPEGKVPVISEYGIFRSTNPLLRSQTHALYIAKCLMEYVRLGSPYIQKHCLVDWYSEGADSLGPTQQAVIQAVPQAGANTSTGEGDYKFFSTPSAHVFEMINGMFGSEVISSRFSYMPKFAQDVDVFNALASKDEEGNIYLAIVNLDKNENRNIEVEVDGVNLADRVVNVQKLVGDSFSEQNTLDKPNNVEIEKSEFIVDGESIKLELDAHSFTILKINN